MDALLAILFGVAGGVVGGLLGVGGGILFVPALTIFLDESQLGAEATSLLAIIPVAAVGTWRHARYGNVHLREGLAIGALSVLGVAVGVVVANSVSERVLELLFAGLLIVIAARLVLRVFGPERRPADAA
ncbi:MAG TPA: sulfite exporter TauE/SafE family protein [Solirubrobacterales bacterium]|nr:sulfite exporter TauE/SafE family protein [Solirubrobacterales bacterium]